MLEYKIDVLKELKKRGYTQAELRKTTRLGMSAIDALRYGNYVSMGTLDKICNLLDCEPGDIIVRQKAS
ncbi:MAG: helix-turn-helix transcriptional regulator [Ruminococcus flavefaciens]|nr:helix-turn-helix transcriptional regulator [Ruminococcus flavefaciens]